jgi:hypothetical protein
MLPVIRSEYYHTLSDPIEVDLSGEAKFLKDPKL